MRRPLLFLLAVASQFFCTGEPTRHTISDTAVGVVRTEGGLVSGVRSGDVMVYRGVPFAAPPVGPLRWKAPQKLAAWSGVKKCESFGASPIQTKPVPFMMYTSEFLIPAEPISEDCLYLNIWTATNTSDTKAATVEKKPVIVWIHGGGFVSGSGSCPIYDGENLAKKGVVMVTINYRLGIFGFLAHPELSKESPAHASGNYAFLDQIAALQWVKDNISGFGGDPDRVTVAGQSAGAFSVNALAASPLAKGLFQRVIAESGGLFNRDGRTLSLQAAEQTGLKIAQGLKVSSLEELRAKSPDELLKAAAMGTLGPVIDGYVLPTNVYSIYENGKENDVPVLTGWNRDEGFASGFAASTEEYKGNAQKTYKDLAPDFLKAYPGNSPAEIKQSTIEWSRNSIFSWHAYTWARLQTEKGKNKVFLYQFDRVPPENEKYGAFHSAEICYALHTLQTWHRPWTDADRKLEDLMSSYWTNFAANGDPNGKNLPVWKAYDKQSNSMLEFDATESGMKPIVAKAGFEFIDKYQQQEQAKK